MYCNKCGQKSAKNAEFCSKCGNKLKVAHQMAMHSRLWVAGSGILLVIMVGIFTTQNTTSDFLNNKNIGHEASETIEGKQEKSLEEEVAEAIWCMENGEENKGTQIIEELYEKESTNSNLYLLLSNAFLERDRVEYAKQFLLDGFEVTEEAELMERYLEISIEYADEAYGEGYETLVKGLELIAEITDNEQKLGKAKEIYFYLKLNE